MIGLKWADFVRGKTYEELYGEKRAEEMKEKRRKGMIGNRYSVGRKGNKNPMYGKHRTEEVKTKLHEKLVGRKKTLEEREEMRSRAKQAWKNPNSKYSSRKLSSHKTHDNMVLKKLVELQNSGYICILLNRMPIPDIIVIKDEKIIPVEIQRGGFNRKKKDFYEKSGAFNFYSDILWFNLKGKRIPNRD